MSVCEFILWKEFQEQAKRDLEASSLLYQKGDYGNAAYHMQQGLEKQVKAVVLKMGLSKYLRLKSLGHFQLPVIIKSMARLVHRILRQHPDNATGELYLLLNIFKKYGEAFTMIKKDENKKIVWKDSLDIELTKEEKCKLHEILPTPNIPKKVRVININKPQNHNMSDAVTDIVVFVDIIRSSTMLLLHVFPHESIGRYPMVINDVSSVWLYEQRSKDLEQLLKRVQSVCLELETIYFRINKKE